MYVACAAFWPVLYIELLLSFTENDKTYYVIYFGMVLLMEIVIARRENCYRAT